MRVAFFGSPAFALPALRALHERHELALVVSQPDKRQGRGMNLRAPPVAQAAKALGLRLEQPGRLKNNAEFHSLIHHLDLDVAVTAAYGKLLPESLLELPEHGFLNVHASLLPKHRGAAPIQWALIRGDRETGISIMQTKAGLDTGPVRLVKRTPVRDEDDAKGLFERLSVLGAEAITEALEALASGQLPCEPQDEGLVSLAPLLVKEDGEIDWEASARDIFNRFRGVIAWPGSFTHYGGRTLKVHEIGLEPASGKPGEIQAVDQSGVLVAAGEGGVRLKTVQPPGKPKMSAYDWVNGYGVNRGDHLD